MNSIVVSEYFLEDIVQMLDFKPVKEKKTKEKKIGESQVNCNLLVSADYPSHIRNTVALIDEDSYHLKLIEVNSSIQLSDNFILIKQILPLQSLLYLIENDLEIDGAVLIFLPGWAWITELNNYLLQVDVSK